MIRCLLLVLFAAFSAQAGAATVALGNLVMRYDETKWELGSQPDGRGVRMLMFKCIADPCPRQQPIVWVSAAPTGIDTKGCGGDVRLGEGGSSRRATLMAGPLALSLITTFSGCRAYVPAHRSACGVDADFVYRFNTGGHAGCWGRKGASEELFRELLSGISRP